MKINSARVADLRPKARPRLQIFLDEMPSATQPVKRRETGNMIWASAAYGQLMEVAAEYTAATTFAADSGLGLAPSGHFNKVFPEFGPAVDVDVFVGDDPKLEGHWLLRLTKARSILRNLVESEPWSYYMADYDGQRGLLSWELIERAPVCQYNTLHNVNHHTRPVPGHARVTVGGIQYPLCSDCLHRHNSRQVQRRHATSK